MDDLLSEILLRIPPDEPAHLVDAALVCKPWLRVVSDPAFRRGYRERHRRPPLLGFIHNIRSKGPIPRFVPTTAAASRCSSPAFDCHDWWALDSRHGRVLVHRFAPDDLTVWNPITGEQQRLPEPPYPHAYFTGAVICAAAGCDHLDCAGGPFLVVFVGTDEHEDVTWASVYSSETRGWSAMAITDFSASVMVGSGSYVESKPSILIGDELYFTLELGNAILKYDLVAHGLSVIDAPVVIDHRGVPMAKEKGIVMVAEDGGLGFAGVEDDELHLWSWNNSAGWTLGRVIQLQSILPIPDPSIAHEVIGFAEGTDIIFLLTDVAVFTLEIKSGKTRKLGEARGYYAVLPYLSFGPPASACCGLIASPVMIRGSIHDPLPSF